MVILNQEIPLIVRGFFEGEVANISPERTKVSGIKVSG